MVVTKDLVDTLDVSKHRINIVGVFAKLGIFDLLENGINSHNCTWIRLLKQQDIMLGPLYSTSPVTAL